MLVMAHLGKHPDICFFEKYNNIDMKDVFNLTVKASDIFTLIQ